MAKLYIGTSGYAYKEWQGDGLFYPPEVKAKDYLSYYASQFNALEGLATFMKMPTTESVAKWISTTPEEFRISPKMHQNVTHRSRLKPSCFELVADFAEKMKPLDAAGKAGPILVQLPPNLKRDDALLSVFLEQLPEGPLEWAIEFRNESWQSPEVEEILRSKYVAWVAEDTDEHAGQRRSTASHHYIRLRKLSYTDEELNEWSQYFQQILADGKDCYVFCRHKDTVSPWVWGQMIRHITNKSGNI